MKQYIFTFVVALIIGFFLCNFFIKQYDDYNGIKVANTGYELYFIEYGAYDTISDMEKNTINLENYIYNEKDNKYYVYIGVTELLDNANRIVEHYKNLGYETSIKKFGITNKEFMEIIKNYDNLLKSIEDETAFSSLISQVLTKYEEVVIRGS